MKNKTKKLMMLIVAIVAAAVLIVWVILTQLKPGVPTEPGGVATEVTVETPTAGE